MVGWFGEAMSIRAATLFWCPPSSFLPALGRTSKPLADAVFEVVRRQGGNGDKCQISGNAAEDARSSQHCWPRARAASSGSENQNAGRAQQPAFTDVQKAAHLVDRITFGPRPGDLERVKQVGWERYLEEQLHPERISDQTAESKVAGIPSLTMTSGQIARSYPPPKVIQEVLKAQGLNVPGQTANNQNKPASQEQTTAGQNGEAEMPPADLLKKRNDARDVQAARLQAAAGARLGAGARLLRAVYSERQPRSHDRLLDEPLQCLRQ